LHGTVHNINQIYFVDSQMIDTRVEFPLFATVLLSVARTITKEGRGIPPRRGPF
jgi:hypothetical protein